jgi:large subunit ribosomal protein L31e
MAEKGKKKEKEAEQAVEKSYTVGLQPVYCFPVTRRIKKAWTFLQRFVFKHTRVKAGNVFMSNGLNEALWARGREHIPRTLAIKIILKGGKANVFLQNEKVELPKEKKGKEKGKEEAKKTDEETAAEKEAGKKREEKKMVEKAAEASAMRRGL